MDQTFLFIDGENFLHKVEDVLKLNNINFSREKLSKININLLLEKALKTYKISRKIFYGAKIHFNKETEKKSVELIKFQRSLKAALEKQGFEFLIAGNVRGQKITLDHKTKIVFREKGVDVKIAVDLVSFSADKKIKTAILCSSDSDLQPAVKEARKRGIKIVYLGFEFQPNKGLTYTCNNTVLFRNSEILEACEFQK